MSPTPANCHQPAAGFVGGKFVPPKYINDHEKEATAVESIPESEEIEQTEVQSSEHKLEEQTEENTEDLNPEEKPKDKPEDKTEEKKKEEDEFNIKGFPKIVIVGLGHVLP